MMDNMILAARDGGVYTDPVEPGDPVRLASPSVPEDLTREDEEYFKSGRSYKTKSRVTHAGKRVAMRITSKNGSTLDGEFGGLPAWGMFAVIERSRRPL